MVSANALEGSDVVAVFMAANGVMKGGVPQVAFALSNEDCFCFRVMLTKRGGRILLSAFARDQTYNFLDRDGQETLIAVLLPLLHKAHHFIGFIDWQGFAAEAWHAPHTAILEDVRT